MTTPEEQVARRVQALPQELYDRILNYTLALPATITIDSAYRPPPQLQIDHATRTRVSRALSGHDGTFVIGNIGLCNQWLQSLSAAARQAIQNIEYVRVAGNNSDQALCGGAASGYAELFATLGRWYDMLSRQAGWNGRYMMIYVRASRHGQGWDMDGGILDEV